MKKASTLPLLLCLLSVAATAQAGMRSHREQDSTTGHTASVEVPLVPVLGLALTRAGLPEAQALRPCVSGWTVDPRFGDAGKDWVAAQAQAACVVSAAETTLADKLTQRVWPTAAALQTAADAAAKHLDLRRIHAACKRPAATSVMIVYGDEVKAQIGSRIAYSCGPEGVTIARDGATFFGGGVIDGRQYKVGLERGSSSKSSVGGAFLSP